MTWIAPWAVGLVVVGLVRTAISLIEQRGKQLSRKALSRGVPSW